MSNTKTWHLAEALLLVRLLEQVLTPVGFHVALMGSVLKFLVSMTTKSIEQVEIEL